MATYSCADSNTSAYGAGDYGTCATQTAIGAPNTGTFQEFVSSGSFTIVAPLVTTLVVVVIATVIIKRRKR